MKPKSTFTVPHTDITVGSLVLSFNVNANSAHISFEALDVDGARITFPKRFDGMTTEEQTAFCVAVNDTLEQAAMPYLARVFGFAPSVKLVETSAETLTSSSVGVVEEVL